MCSHWLLLITCNYQINSDEFWRGTKGVLRTSHKLPIFLANYDFVPLNKTTTERELNARNYKMMEGGRHSSIRQPKAIPEV